MCALILPVLRVHPSPPPESMPDVRASPHDALLSRTRLPRQSALGLRTLPDVEKRLVPKIMTRIHVSGGAVLMRPCFCYADALAARGIGQIHDFRRIARDSAGRGAPLFFSLGKNDINRILRGTLTTMGVEEAQSYSAHAFRGGGIDAI